MNMNMLLRWIECSIAKRMEHASHRTKAPEDTTKKRIMKKVK
jgi:hypothetical protein